MSLPIIKATKYDLLMNNISTTLTSDECLVILEDTGEVFHWEPNKYLNIYGNAHIDRYTKLINQMNCNRNNIGYTVDINGRIESPYQKQYETIANIRYAARKEAIDPYSRMTLKVNDKHTLCLSCGRFVHIPKIGKYKDKYCDKCGCYMPEIMFGGDL